MTDRPELLPASISSADLDQLVGLTRQVAWPHMREDWTDFAHTARLWVIRRDDRSMASCVMLYDYATRLSSIGLMIVHEDMRGRGHAGALMRTCMSASSGRVLSLIATKMGAPVYEHLGFRRVGAVVRMIGRWRPSSETSSAVRSSATDIDAALALDARACGDSRAPVLRRFIARADGFAGVRAADGSLRAFALALRKSGYLQCAPVIAGDDESALALIDSLARAEEGAVRIDVPVERESLLARLETHGLERASVDPIMTLGGATLPGERELVRGISFQALG